MFAWGVSVFIEINDSTLRWKNEICIRCKNTPLGMKSHGGTINGRTWNYNINYRTWAKIMIFYNFNRANNTMYEITIHHRNWHFPIYFQYNKFKVTMEEVNCRKYLFLFSGYQNSCLETTGNCCKRLIRLDNAQRSTLHASHWNKCKVKLRISEGNYIWS